MAKKAIPEGAGNPYHHKEEKVGASLAYVWGWNDALVDNECAFNQYFYEKEEEEEKAAYKMGWLDAKEQ